MYICDYSSRRAFRILDMQKRLEDVTTAVEEVEPGALKKIEVLVERRSLAYITSWTFLCRKL